MLSTERINTGRQFEFDCAKFITILLMITVHTYENLSGISYIDHMPETPFRIIMEFLDGPPGVPVFMLAMGVGIVYTRNNTPQMFFRRGLKLLLAGYALNFFRVTLPLLIAELIGINDGTAFETLPSLFIVDIFQFAGLSFLCIGLMKRFRASSWTMLAVALILQLIGIWGNRVQISGDVPALLVGLLIHTHRDAAFPLTLWLVYPVAGIVFGEFLQRVTDKRAFYLRVGAVAGLVFIAETLALVNMGVDLRYIFALTNDMWYLQEPIRTVWGLSFALCWISLLYLLLAPLEHTTVGRFLRFSGTNLTRIYVVQWFLISYTKSILVLLDIYALPDPLLVIPVAIVFVVLSFVIAWLLGKIRPKRAPVR